jgi:heme-degrading monooxygenase HmoA
MFQTQPGFAAVLFTSHETERAVITLWESWDCVDALGASPSYRATVKDIEAAGFLRGEQSVEVFALDRIFTSF